MTVEEMIRALEGWREQTTNNCYCQKSRKAVGAKAELIIAALKASQRMAESVDDEEFCKARVAWDAATGGNDE